MNKHTPEPWKIGRTTNFILNHDSSLHVAVCHHENDANASRIVACVNAMAGIDDPIKLRDTWDAIEHLELDAYYKEKEKSDRLLSKLKELVHALKHRSPLQVNFIHEMIEAVKLIEELKGGENV